MIRAATLSVVLAFSALSFAQDGELHEWVSDKGHTVKASLVRSETETIYVLRTSDGREIRVPENRLNAASRMLAEKLLSARGEEGGLFGQVVAIADGDTFTFRDDSRARQSVRLEAIDCPEGAQEHGREATKALAGMIQDERVRLKVTGKDRYGRTLAHVYLAGRWINHDMIAEGHAWHYKKYSDDETLAKAERDARSKRIGLWASSSPVAPWDFRAAQRGATPPVGSVTNSERETGDEDTELTHWLTTSSRKRHNKSCRYYEHSNGRPCRKDEGIPCKICGG